MKLLTLEREDIQRAALPASRVADCFSGNCDAAFFLDSGQKPSFTVAGGSSDSPV
jgi:hypothetical protein